MKNQKGITLIALIITIIVLLILAGVSISAIVGNNGVIEKSINATETHKKEAAAEKVMLALDEWKIKEKLETTTFKEFLQDKFGVDNVTDNNNGTFTIKVDGYEITVNENEIKGIEKNNNNENDKDDDNISVVNPGLYDAEWNLLLSWEELTTETEERNPILCVYEDEELTELSVEEGEEENIAGNLVIAEGITDMWGVSGCSELLSITIPKTVTNINEDGFYGCTKLKEIIVDSENSNYSSENGILYNKDKSILIRYPSGKDSTTYEIPSNVTSLACYAFEQTQLTSIIIPSNVKSIGDMAFYEASNLETITISNGVTSIGYGSFTDCSSLSTITIPDSVTTISSGAFIRTGLTEINVSAENSNYSSENRNII